MGFLVLGQNNLRASGRVSNGETHKLASNSTGCLFYLEETMSTELGKKNYSRKKARRFWEQTYSTLPRCIVVHHNDENPFNNNLDNLTPMKNGEHTSYHASKIPNWGRRVSNVTLLERLERALVIFNDH